MRGLAIHAEAIRRGHRIVLREVGLTLSPGRVTAVVGPNGSGKTTLLRCLAGLGSSREARVVMDGVDIRSMPASIRGQKLAWLPRPDMAPFPFTARETVMLGRYPWNSGHPTPADERAVDRVIASLRIADMAERLMPTLSAGEHQKVMLARAMVVEPAYLLVDEPFANLDAGAVADLASVFRGLAAHGTGVVATLHDLPLAREIADEVVLLGNGRIAGVGSPGAILTPERILSIYGVRSTVERLSDGTDVLIVRHGAGSEVRHA